MIKLLLRLRVRPEVRERGLVDIQRPILWAVCPVIGTKFWVSKESDFFFPVVDVHHCPTGDCIEILFETRDRADLESLLSEKDGGWRKETLDWPPNSWPKPEDHPTAWV